MYRLLPKQLIFVGFGWLVLGVFGLIHLANTLAGARLTPTSAPQYAWLLLYLILWNPIWRFVWKKFPILNRWFPDLNGTWNVELRSNWPRQQQLLNAAQSGQQLIDIRHCPEAELVPLTTLLLTAEIRQTWWNFEIRLTNPKSDTPIDRSDTITVEPFSGKGMQPAHICYFFKQVNATANVSDDNEFYGAARLSYRSESDRLEGLFWTARMWQRAMNTAGTIIYTRV